MTTTIEWTQAHGVCIEATVPFKEQVGEPCPRSVEKIAIRSIILHTVGLCVNKEKLSWLDIETLEHS
ncbi:hypothetical protein [Acaryochloris sp. CCMEE 5410]|uniref:hypothetical protein n=1 Tax=Acaryochloris sp. CCMEE 5410 TaxID=310037 RepID=UPI000248453A|nr:hypothetical protein [Acaryochloris sp. CCMEE 5410]KAI9134856.1 hypothetical protein ON05_017425 [Acaryochloris sp. CCMEE 5410]